MYVCLYYTESYQLQYVFKLYQELKTPSEDKSYQNIHEITYHL